MYQVQIMTSSTWHVLIILYTVYQVYYALIKAGVLICSSFATLVQNLR